MRLPFRVWLAVGVLVALAAVGFGYAAIPDSDGTIHACMLNATGTIRLIDPSNSQDQRNQCRQLETQVDWNQQGLPGAQGPPGPQGPQGPAGNTDTTVRNATGFIVNGTSAASPVISGAGRLGTLSFTCSDVTYTTNTADTNAFADRIMFYSPEVPDSPSAATINESGVGDHLTVPWSGASQNRWFQMLIEGMTGSQTDVTLTTINGWVRGFPQFSGCAYFAYVQTSDVRSPQTFTP
jgi:hypothetical protein